MLVYKKKDIPSDPVFPIDLERLGFFINDEDQIRQIANPEEVFKYKINANDRWNEVRCNAFNECIRRIVVSRLNSLGLSTMRLPLGAQADEKHVPILCSSNINTAPRIVVIFGSPDQELGIWTYRSISERSIAKGSMEEITRAILKERTDTALVIANTGQLVWHCGSSQAISQRCWYGLPSETAAHPPMRQTYRNVIARNETWREHVKCIFEDVLAPRRVDPKAKIDIIGVEEGGQAAVEFLAQNWSTWKNSISAIVFARPLHQKHDLDPEGTLNLVIPSGERDTSSFAHFVSARSRAYVLSDKPFGEPVPGTFEIGCNTYSSNEAVNHEDVVVASWPSMLQWLDKLYADPSYEEVEMIVEEPIREDEEEWEKWRRREIDAVDDMGMQTLAVSD